MEYVTTTYGERRRIHREYVDIYCRMGRDGQILPVRILWRDGRSFPVDEVVEPGAAGRRRATACAHGLLRGHLAPCQPCVAPVQRRAPSARSSGVLLLVGSPHAPGQSPSAGACGLRKLRPVDVLCSHTLFSGSIAMRLYCYHAAINSY